MKNPKRFNPLDKHVLGQTVVEALLNSDTYPLGRLKDFKGAGIYAVYYRGSFESYSEIAARNKKELAIPIYVGKAEPKGRRKGSNLDASRTTTALFKRLQDHAKSIESSTNLDLKDFECQIILVDEIWIGLGESLVIERFKPLWNTVVEGFGNHDPGKGRYKGKRPLWDELHPGRSWAAKCAPAKLSTMEILSLVEEYSTTL